MKNHIIISLLFLSVGLSQQLIPQITETYKNGNIKSITYHYNTRDKIEKVKNVDYYENGQRSREGSFKDGKLDGVMTSWYEKGKKKGEGTYKDGEKDGIWTKWDKNDGKVYKGKFTNLKDKNIDRSSLNGSYFSYFGDNIGHRNLKDGEINGLVIIWHPSGEKKLEATYKNGKEDGLYTRWHNSVVKVQKELEGTYKDGKKDGLWTKWYYNGDKKLEGVFKDGELITKNEY
jgi:antitoxin component YwqK of YwqJK toxin-antitoxin module